jgi:hypothetical protein
MSARPTHRKEDGEDDSSRSSSGRTLLLASSLEGGGRGQGERGPCVRESTTDHDLRRSASDHHPPPQRPATMRRWRRQQHVFSNSLLGRALFHSFSSSSSSSIRKRDYTNAWRRRTALLTAAMILITLTWMYYSFSSRVRSLEVEHSVRQRQRAERLGKLVFLTDRHSSAEWQASPILEVDDDDEHLLVVAAAKKESPTDDSESVTGRSSEYESNDRGSIVGPPQEGRQREEAPSLDSVLRMLANLPLSDPRQRNRQLEEIFDRHRIRLAHDPNQAESQALSSLETAQHLLEPILQTWLHHWNQDVLDNAAGGSARWVRPYLLRPPEVDSASSLTSNEAQASLSVAWVHHQYPEYFAIVRRNHRMKWQEEWDAMSDAGRHRGPIVDYTSADKYEYPLLPHDPTASYFPVQPRWQPLGELLTRWKQNDDQPGRIRETLVHLDYRNLQHVDMALQHRRAGIPFKVVNVPDVAGARFKWTDEYLSNQFDEGRGRHGLRAVHPSSSSIEAAAIESINNVFVPYQADKWDIFQLGLAPTRDVTDWTYAQWSHHARYADSVRLGADQPHFAWQVRRTGPQLGPSAGTPSNGTFVSRDVRVP